MNGGRIVVQCATPLELAALREAFGAGEPSRFGRRRAAAVADDGRVVLFRGSVGHERAYAGAREAIEEFEPSLVVDFGAAGGLTASVQVGDLVVASAVVRATADTRGAVSVTNKIGVTDALGWSGDVEGLARATRAAVAAVDWPVASVEQRRALAVATGAVVACWESAAVAEACLEHGVAFGCARVVTDVGQAPLESEYAAGASRALGPAAAALARLLLRADFKAR